MAIVIFDPSVLAFSAKVLALRSLYIKTTTRSYDNALHPASPQCGPKLRAN
jgi:hypothetical protein